MNDQIRNLRIGTTQKNQIEGYGTKKYHSNILKIHWMGLKAGWKGKKKKSVTGR